MNKIINILMMFLCGCGGAEIFLADPGSPVWDAGTVLIPWTEPTDPRPDPSAGIPGEVQPYVDKFVRLWGSEWGDVPVRLVDVSGSAIGVCTQWSSGHRSIDIDATWWASADITQREIAVFHEAGHCHLYRPHDERTEQIHGLGSNVPASVMYPYALPNKYYLSRRSYYRDELFDRE